MFVCLFFKEKKGGGGGGRRVTIQSLAYSVPEHSGSARKQKIAP